MQATLGNLSNVLRSLGPLRLALLGGTGLATLGLLAFLAFRVSEPPMGLLYGELDTRDAAQVVAALDRARVPYRIGRSGAEILAPDDQIPRLRLMLARDGLPSGGSVGYEVFDRQGGLTTTPFQQDINRLRALEGEIARTIRGLAGVAAARVHLVLPRREPFSRERGEAQASIVLQMRGVQRLDREGVQAVVQLVAAAVPGLKPQNVAIVDSRGELLARGGRALEGGLDSSLPQEEARRAQEARIARGVEEMLERALGPGHVRAEATLELNYERHQVTEERYDPDNQVPRSQQSVTESSRNGEPSSVTVANQLPGAPPAQPSGPQSQEQRQEETTNFEIGRTTKTTVREQPMVRRISVAVLVDGVREPPEAPGEAARYRERSPEELARITALVRGAIGFDEARGDRVEVVSLRFGDAAGERVAEAGAPGWLDLAMTPSMVTRLAESALLALVALAAVLVIGRPMVKRLAVEVLPKAAAAPALAGAPAAAAGVGVQAAGAALAAPGAEDSMVSMNMVEGQIRASSLQKVTELADRHPDETLAVIRRWLAPEDAQP
ncbi:flagellar basal-body MS-ring/collar protein FliF [Roseicella aquatilis]|uniref:Flagellar M-ring protein n=1 Tax=Roseicella aquatilis TaxID=2527868 RepID=A0A4R4DBD5_9PROT|nr:flagellar basal-body MS-ring/collar protein FliF [Roseicella aquatilis]TCZ57980.1 flagellar M-ring protein FliF [Roseicella aquatilis]